MKRVLIVEDDGHLRRVLKTLLEAEGFEVEEAEDGQAGLEAATSSPPHCILTDTLMPKIDGLDMLSRIAKAGGGAPAIVVSAVHQLPGREELERLGVIEVFGKPFAFDMLVEAVRRAVSQA